MNLPAALLRQVVDQLEREHYKALDPHQAHDPLRCGPCGAILEARRELRKGPWPEPARVFVRGFTVSSKDLGNNWSAEHHARRLGLMPPWSCPACGRDVSEIEAKRRHCPHCEAKERGTA